MWAFLWCFCYVLTDFLRIFLAVLIALKLEEYFASDWVFEDCQRLRVAVTDCSAQERSVTPNMMIPRRGSVNTARRASVVSSRPITPATGRQSQMIGIDLHALANVHLIVDTSTMTTTTITTTFLWSLAHSMHWRCYCLCILQIQVDIDILLLLFHWWSFTGDLPITSLTYWPLFTGCAFRSRLHIRLPCWHSEFFTEVHRCTLDRSCQYAVFPADGCFVLQAPIVFWCHLSSDQPSAAMLSRLLARRPGIPCQKM